jgi:hypothetical protein
MMIANHAPRAQPTSVIEGREFRDRTRLSPAGAGTTSEPRLLNPIEEVRAVAPPRGGFPAMRGRRAPPPLPGFDRRLRRGGTAQHGLRSLLESEASPIGDPLVPKHHGPAWRLNHRPGRRPSNPQGGPTIPLGSMGARAKIGGRVDARPEREGRHEDHRGAILRQRPSPARTLRVERCECRLGTSRGSVRSKANAFRTSAYPIRRER